MKKHAHRLLLTSLLVTPALTPLAASAQTKAEAAAEAQIGAQGEELQQQMLRCSVVGDPSARLGCFDALSKAAVKLQTAATSSSNPAKVANAVAAVEVPAVADKKVVPETPISRTVQLWELDDASKRGRFVFRPHRDNYLLIANYSTSSNDQPYRETTPGGLQTQHVELTYQLSFKTKLLEGIRDTPIDLWFGYTQQSFWQAYNRKDSSPFRETNYQPEIMATLPINKTWGGLDFRYANLGFVHQSNGQTSTLSRSWNRVYAELGVDKDNFAAQARIWKRTDTGAKDNDNPDITDFLGHGDLTLKYRENGNEFSAVMRRNFSTRHGSLQAGWGFPLAANLKGYLQLFSGYGQSLIDYNYSQKSLGAGVLVDF